MDALEHNRPRKPAEHTPHEILQPKPLQRTKTEILKPKRHNHSNNGYIGKLAN